MCEYSGRLVAWLDGELAVEEAVAVEWHVGVCAVCRAQASVYRRVSADVKAYCEARAGAEASRSLPQWLFAASGVAAVAALVLVLSGVVPGPRTGAPPGPAHSVAPVAAIERTETAVAVHELRRQARAGRAVPEPTSDSRPRRVALSRREDSNWSAADAALDIVVPADALFPPGAAPEGISFQVSVGIGADGSAERLWWQP
jgi:hypothetical protein